MKLASSSVLVVLGLALCGCAKVPATRYYVLEPRGTAPAGTAGYSGEGLSIGVRAFQVAALRASRAGLERALR